MWLPVLGFEKSYQVSNFGKVRSIDREGWRPHSSGQVKVIMKGKILKPAASRSGHLTVVLGRNNTKQVHALVLTSFVGVCPEGLECRHLDDNPSNNHISNLKWGTRSENLYDAVRNKKKPIAEKAPHAKLNRAAVFFIRENKNKFSFHSMGQKFGVSANAVKQVIDQKTWKSIK